MPTEWFPVRWDSQTWNLFIKPFWTKSHMQCAPFRAKSWLELESCSGSTIWERKRCWESLKIRYVFRFVKVEKILEGSQDSIPSFSFLVKFQIMSRKICLSCKGKTLLGIVANFWKQKKSWHHPGFTLLPQVNFPIVAVNNLNFQGRWWDEIQAIFLNFSTLHSIF